MCMNQNLMQNGKRIFVICLLFCLLLAMTGCNQDEKVLKEAVENLNAAQSMTAESEMEMDMAVGDTTIGMHLTYDQKSIHEPLQCEMDVVGTIETGGETMDMTNKLYCETVDEKLQVYTQFGGNWYNAGDGSTTSLAQQFDIAKVMELYVSAMQDFAAAGTETINGVETTRYEGVLSEEYFKQVLDESGVLSQIGLSSDIDEDTLKELFTDIGSVPITIWVDTEAETVMPVQYAFDMTSMMQSIIKKLGGDAMANVTVEKVYMRMTITGADNVDSITIPEEAKNSSQR